MSKNSQSGNPPIQSAKADYPTYYRAVFDAVLPYSSALKPMDTALIDDQYILLSNLAGQLAMMQGLAANVSTRESLEINACDFAGYVDALERQLSVIKAVHEALEVQVSDLRNEHDKQIEAYEFQLDKLRKELETNKKEG